MATLRTGTSNVVVPGAKATFPEAFQSTSRLHYYSTLFTTVELNSTFYRLPKPETFAKWADEVGNGFKFSVKLWRGITHPTQLTADLSDIDRFMKAADNLGGKKGCLLIQFPPSFTAKLTPRLRAILDRLHEADPNSAWPKAVEFRHPSWHTDETYDLLDEHRASLVIHDKGPGRTSSLNPGAEVVYLRYHGPKGDYRESYDTDFLQGQAELIADWLAEGKDVYAYFNNTMGAAFANARELQGLVSN